MICRLSAVLNQERTIHNIGEFDKTKLKHAETEVKNPLPDKEGEIVYVRCSDITELSIRLRRRVGGIHTLNNDSVKTRKFDKSYFENIIHRQLISTGGVQFHTRQFASVRRFTTLHCCSMYFQHGGFN